MEGRGTNNMNTGQRLGVVVGAPLDTKPTDDNNIKELREEYVHTTLARGYRAYLRGDGCEGRRFRHFMERGEERKRTAEMDIPVTNSGTFKKLKRVEQRGMRLTALLNLVPSLFHSGWMLLPSRKRQPVPPASRNGSRNMLSGLIDRSRVNMKP